MSRKSTIETLPFLADVRKKYYKVERAFERVEEIQESMARIAPFNSVKVQTDRNIHVVENAAIALSDAKSDLADCINEYLDAFSFARSAIMSLDEADYIMIVHLRDIMMLNWNQVAERTGFTVQWTYKIYMRAIEKLKVYEK